MQDKTLRAARIMALVLLGVGIIGIVDGVIQPPYWLKSVIKVVLFGAVPAVYAGCTDRELKLKALFRLSGGSRGLKEALFWGSGVFAVIVGGYLLLGGWFDFSQITGNLERAMGIGQDNFLFVALYISFCNSLLEEFFFRGLACLSLQNYVSRRTAWLFSALAFSLYHVAMMWVAFEPPLVLVSLAGLMAGGCIFNFFNEKYGNIYISWLIHMGANFAINGIAMHLFGMF